MNYLPLILSFISLCIGQFFTTKKGDPAPYGTYNLGGKLLNIWIPLLGIIVSAFFIFKPNDELNNLSSSFNNKVDSIAGDYNKRLEAARKEIVDSVVNKASETTKAIANREDSVAYSKIRHITHSELRAIIDSFPNKNETVIINYDQFDPESKAFADQISDTLLSHKFKTYVVGGNYMSEPTGRFKIGKVRKLGNANDYFIHVLHMERFKNK